MLEQRPTQCQRLLSFFTERQGQKIRLPELLDLNISQYNARILELRRQGHVIECGEEIRSGVERHTWYIYRGRAEAAIA